MLYLVKDATNGWTLVKLKVEKKKNIEKILNKKTISAICMKPVVSVKHN